MFLGQREIVVGIGIVEQIVQDELRGATVADFSSVVVVVVVTDVLFSFRHFALFSLSLSVSLSLSYALCFFSREANSRFFFVAFRVLPCVY